MKLKKMICMLMSISILLAGITVHADFLSQNQYWVQTNTVDQYAPEDEVTFIVEVDGEPELVSKQAQAMGAPNYIKTAEAQKAEENILKKQTAVIQEIERHIKPDVEKGYTYSALFNGFSIHGEFQDREAILALPGVKNVYISQKHYMEAPLLSSAGDLTHVPEAVEAFNYQGEGQVVAVIDSEFDTGHEFFSAPVDNPKYSKTDIEQILSDTTMNVSVAANQVYKNSKIPFAFDYANKNADTFDDIPAHVHGTHVAGIVAGKNGTAPDGKSFSGIAPEAQMILMKISDRSGAMIDADILAAIDDASKLGVSAINMSFGADYIPTAYEVDYLPILSAARNAGIFLSVAAGNANRGHKELDPIVENIDYAAAGTPNSYSVATSIASVDNLFQYIDAGKLILPDGQSVTYNNAYSGAGFDKTFGSTQCEYVYCGLGKSTDFNGLDLTGKIALVRRGENMFIEKADNAKAAGAEGLIIWNNENDFLVTDELSIPCAVVLDTEGQLLFDAEVKKIDVTPVESGQSTLKNGGKPSSFTSWGTGETLELKPELSAPGGQIYSSVPNDKYQSFNGTSMAAPHITGLVALMNQFYESDPFSAQYNHLVGNDKVSLFENLLMSSAAITRDDQGIPHSPRRQGAGLANIKNAMLTPVFLESTEGKTKISLGQGLESTFTLHFQAKNLTDHEITYDNLTLDVTTDGYITKDGQHYVDGTRRLSAKSDLPDRIIVPADGETEIIINVTLDADELAANAEIFTNGFYIDGFVSLASSGEIPQLSIPFTGFRGNWRDAPIFDTTIYDEGGSTLYVPDDPRSQGTYLYSYLDDNTTLVLGKNPFSEDSIVNRDYIAFSPNGDGIFDELALNIQPLRAMSSIQVQITDADGNPVMVDTFDEVIPKFIMTFLRFNELPALSDGDYTLHAYGLYAYPGTEGSYDDSFSIPFAVDTEKPVVTEVEIDEEKNTLMIAALDNRFISTVAIGYTDVAGEEVWNFDTFDPAAEDGSNGVCTAEFDIAGIDPNTIKLEVYDYAMNVSSGNLTDFTGDICVSLKDFQQISGMTSADFTITNRTESPISGMMMFAFYDNDHRLIHLEMSNTTLQPGEQTHELRMVADTSNAVIMKVFFWDQLATMRPLYPTRTFDIT